MLMSQPERERITNLLGASRVRILGLETPLALTVASVYRLTRHSCATTGALADPFHCLSRHAKAPAWPQTDVGGRGLLAGRLGFFVVLPWLGLISEGAILNCARTGRLVGLRGIQHKLGALGASPAQRHVLALTPGKAPAAPMGFLGLCPQNCGLKHRSKEAARPELVALWSLGCGPNGCIPAPPP